MISPMLARKYEDFKNSVLYPCHVQPKLDGIRCIAEMKNGVCTLYSRTGKALKMEHIKLALESADLKDVVLDGEFYNHDIKFEKIAGLAGSKSSKKDSDLIQYHVYDIVDNRLSFADRTAIISMLNFKSEFIHKVKTLIVISELQLTEIYKFYKSNNYEGAMIRNSESSYVCDRSSNLLKMKSFDDAEFKIIGIKSGVGKMENHAVFECETSDKKTFSCKMEGSYDYLKEIFLNQSLALGKKLTVRFQGLTSNNIPRFPVGVCIRNYE